MTETIVCLNCGGHITKGGGAPRKGGRRQRYQCANCGATFVTDEMKEKDFRFKKSKEEKSI